MSATGAALVAAAAAWLASALPAPSRSVGGPAPGALAVGVLATTGGVVASTGRVPVLLVLLVVACGFALRQARSRRAKLLARQRRAESVIAVCEGIAADLRAGLPPLAALEAGAMEWAELRPVVDSARLGGDVAHALTELSVLPGAGELRAVAAAWTVAHRSGARLADSVALAADTIRADRATLRVVETELASARATGRLLAALPLGVLLLGRGAGGDPFAFLLGTTAGLVCLCLGIALLGAGLAWLDRIAEDVRR